MISLSRAVGGALAAVAIMAILVVALLNRTDAKEPAGSPTVQSPSSSPVETPPSPTPSPTPTATVLPASGVTVQVLNGTPRTGLAAQTAQEIEKKGYKLAGTGNTARTEDSTIFFKKGRRAEALAFQKLFPDFKVLKEAPASQTAILRAVLGADWPETA
jgi:hypothetical protein